jgi:hypothetical protein
MGYNNSIQNGPHDYRGGLQRSGFQGEIRQSGLTYQSNQSEGRSDIKGGQHLAHLGPHRGDSTSSSFIYESQLRGFLHAPLCGLSLSRLSFPIRDYPRKKLDMTWPRFDRGCGGTSPYLILWRGTCPGWLSPMNGDPGSTQILTRHCGAKSQTISQLTNLRTASTRQVSTVQPLWVIKTLVDRVGVQATPPSNNLDRTMGLH